MRNDLPRCAVVAALALTLAACGPDFPAPPPGKEIPAPAPQREHPLPRNETAPPATERARPVPEKKVEPVQPGDKPAEAPVPSPAPAAFPAPSTPTGEPPPVAAPEGPPAVSLYVAPDGDDTWSGRHPKRQVGGTEGPFATLERARDEARKIKAAGPLPKGGITVWLGEGTYYLKQTFKLGAEDSGVAEAPMVYRAADGSRPILSGGRPITQFKSDQGQILRANLSPQGLKGAKFRQLFFEGKRLPLARYPNYDAENPIAGGWAYADGAPIPMYKDIDDESKKSLRYKESDARKWSRPSDGEVMVFPRYNWWNNIVRIESVDEKARIVTLKSNCSYAIRPNDRYYVQGLREELDAPGEWYLDEAKGDLYLWPPKPLGKEPVIAPVLRDLIAVGPGASHITLRGLTLEYAEGNVVTIKDSSHCLVAACTIRNAGDYSGSAIAIAGGTDCAAVGNDIHDIGRNGIGLSGGDRVTLTPANHRAENNYIHHSGVYYKQGVGVSLAGVGLRAAHNLIHDMPRFAVQYSGNNLAIEYNRVRHLCLETADTGAFYTGGRDWISSRGSIIRHNFITDVIGFGQEDGQYLSPHYAWGVYHDDNTGAVDVYGNIVARCVRALIHLHNGRDNHIENNIFVDGTLQQIECSGWQSTGGRWAEHFEQMVKGYESVAGQPAWRHMRHMELHPKDAGLPDGTTMAGNVFARNIVCYSDPDAALFRVRNFSFDHNASDSNLVWHAGLPIKTGQFACGKTLSDNLVANPGFEEGADGKMPSKWRWQQHPNPAPLAAGRAEPGAGGKRALRIDLGETGDAKGKKVTPIIAGDDIPSKPGQGYRLTARIKTSGPDTRASIAGQSYVANAYFWMKGSHAQAGAEWKETELVFRMPAPGDKDYKPQMKALRVRLEVTGEPGTAWFDDISLVEVEALDEWESWKQKGFDQNSIVADPMFVDPAKDDFRLKPGSPAQKIGFQPIPIDRIGPYQDPLRASWPIVEAPGFREKTPSHWKPEH